MSVASDLWLSRKPLAGFVLIGVAWAAFFAQMPEIKARIGASDGSYGTALLLSSGGALLALWLAPLTERFLGRWGLPVAGFAVGLGMLGAGLSSDIVTFGLAMAVASMGAGVVDVLINVRVSEIETREGRALMNLNHGLYSFSYAGGAVAAGILREAGWSPAEVFLLLMPLVIGLCAAMLPRRAVSVPAAPEGERGMPTGLVVIAGTLVMVSFLTESASEGWSALHLERTLGGGPAEGALGPAILGLSMGVGRLTGHLLGHRFRDLQVMAAGSVVTVIGLVLAAVAPGLWIAYLGFALTGLGASVIAPLALAQLGRGVSPEARLQAISRASVMGYGAFFIGPPLMGFTSEIFGLRAGFLVVAFCFMAAAAFLLPALARSVRRANP